MKQKFLLERIVLAIRAYFKLPVPNINHATHVVPRKLYYHYGNIIAAYPITEQDRLDRQRMFDEFAASAPQGSPEYLEGVRHSALCDCFTCPLSDNIPCPLVNTLSSGEFVCHSHRYAIIKKQ